MAARVEAEVEVAGAGPEVEEAGEEAWGSRGKDSVPQPYPHT